MSLVCDRCGTVNPDYVPSNRPHIPTMTERVEKLMVDFAIVGELLHEYRAELDNVECRDRVIDRLDRTYVKA